jgi:hypothetical protein
MVGLPGDGAVTTIPTTILTCEPTGGDPGTTRGPVITGTGAGTMALMVVGMVEDTTITETDMTEAGTPAVTVIGVRGHTGAAVRCGIRGPARTRTLVEARVYITAGVRTFGAAINGLSLGEQLPLPALLVHRGRIRARRPGGAGPTLAGSRPEKGSPKETGTCTPGGTEESIAATREATGAGGIVEIGTSFASPIELLRRSASAGRQTASPSLAVFDSRWTDRPSTGSNAIWVIAPRVHVEPETSAHTEAAGEAM